MSKPHKRLRSPPEPRPAVRRRALPSGRQCGRPGRLVCVAEVDIVDVARIERGQSRHGAADDSRRQVVGTRAGQAPAERPNGVRTPSAMKTLSVIRALRSIPVDGAPPTRPPWAARTSPSGVRPREATRWLPEPPRRSPRDEGASAPARMSGGGGAAVPGP
jgi:hypothetical protein